MKLEAHKACLKLIEGRIKSAQETIERAKEASLNETKSSAGDKFETGKAMMQTEIAKAEQQLGRQQPQRQLLQLAGKAGPTLPQRLALHAQDRIQRVEIKEIIYETIKDHSQYIYKRR